MRGQNKKRFYQKNLVKPNNDFSLFQKYIQLLKNKFIFHQEVI